MIFGSLAAAGFTKSASGAFNPATLSLSLWQRDYPNSSWSGVASAGGSGSVSMSSGAQPGAGSTLNGHPTASFNGTTHTLSTSVNITSIFTNGAGSALALFNASAASADPGASLIYKIPPFLNDSSAGNFDFGYTTSGVGGGYYNGLDWNSVASAANTSNWHLAQMKWDGTTLNVRVDSGAWVPLLRGAISSLTATPAQTGLNAFSSTGFTGTIAELIASQSALSDSDFDNIKSYINTRYALAL